MLLEFNLYIYNYLDLIKYEMNSIQFNSIQFNLHAISFNIIIQNRTLIFTKSLHFFHQSIDQLIITSSHMQR